MSIKFKKGAGRSEQRLLVYDAEVDLYSAALTLHSKIRDLSIKRQNQTGLRQKVKWALNKEKYLKQLIEGIKSLVDDLIELYPVAQALQ